MTRLSLFLALAIASPGFAQIVPPKVDAVKVPATAKAKAGQTSPLVIENPPAKISWVVFPADGIVIWREHSDDAKLLKLRLEIVAIPVAKKVASAPLEYALTINADGDLKVCIITVEGALPMPPPDQPAPVDPLEKLGGVVSKLEARVALLENPPPPPPVTLSIAPTSVSPGGIVIARWTNAPAGAWIGIGTKEKARSVRWYYCFIPSGGFGVTIPPATTPGSYLVQMFVHEDPVSQAVELTVGGGPPPPLPPDVPINKVKSLTFVVFSPTPTTVLLTEDEALRSWLKARGVGVYGMTTQEQLNANAKFKAYGVTAPSVVFQDDGGRVIWESSITNNTPETIKSLITKFGGGK